MIYGDLPVTLGTHKVIIPEMMFYQYLPIKFPTVVKPIYEERLKCFDDLIGNICCDFVGEFGLDRYVDSYVYLTAKHMYQMNNCSFNRMGYHSDGFLTDDINYIWYNKNPTIFNNSYFNLTLDDSISMDEMNKQALKEYELTYPENSLLRLNQYNIHKVNDFQQPGMRGFVKVSFSKDKYDLLGNTHNYLIDYNWDMKERKAERNIPQSKIL